MCVMRKNPTAMPQRTPIQFRDSGLRQFGTGIQQDLIDGVKWAIAQGYANPKRICVFGGSFGYIGAGSTPGNRAPAKQRGSLRGSAHAQQPQHHEDALQSRRVHSPERGTAAVGIPGAPRAAMASRYQASCGSHCSFQRQFQPWCVTVFGTE